MNENHIIFITFNKFLCKYRETHLQFTKKPRFLPYKPPSLTHKPCDFLL